jgi:hypothetical protein
VPQTTFNVGYVAVESVPVEEVVVVALPPLLLPPQALTTSASPAATTVAIATDIICFVRKSLHLFIRERASIRDRAAPRTSKRK